MFKEPEKGDMDINILRTEDALETKPEIIAEGLCLLLLILAWIPVIMVATTPGGAASQIGNAYFFSWILVVFIAETAVWFVHDLREKMHKSLRQRTEEYHERQRQVLEKTRAIQAEKVRRLHQQASAAARKRANSSGGSSMAGGGGLSASQHSASDAFPDYSEAAGGDNDADDIDFSDFERDIGAANDEQKRSWDYPGSTEFFDTVP